MTVRLFPLVLALLACGPREIVVLVLPPAEDGGRQEPNIACLDNSDCVRMEMGPGPGMPMRFGFCEKPSCGEGVAGVCRQRPAGCPAVFSPVCGCDGVNYWNNCMRQDNQVAFSTEGECAAPVTCSETTPCAAAASSCALLLLDSASSCSTVPTGVCWVVPQICGEDTTGAWESCSGPPVCGGLCAAIRAGETRRKINSCP